MSNVIKPSPLVYHINLLTKLFKPSCGLFCGGLTVKVTADTKDTPLRVKGTISSHNSQRPTINRCDSCSHFGPWAANKCNEINKKDYLKQALRSDRGGGGVIIRPITAREGDDNGDCALVAIPSVLEQVRFLTISPSPHGTHLTRTGVPVGPLGARICVGGLRTITSESDEN